jgi:uncharacterized protein (TIGR00369 family)
MSTGREAQHEPLPAEVEARWMRFGQTGAQLYVNLLGLTIEAVRTDYCRMRMPFQTQLRQAAGIVHGGAIASLLDAVVVPVVGSAYGKDARFSTVDLHVQYLSALIDDDAVAEGWVVKRGRSTVFCESEAVAATSGKLIARSMLTYNVSV